MHVKLCVDKLYYIKYVCVVSSICPVYFSSAVHTAPPVHNIDRPFSTEPYRSGVISPVKSRSYRHSGQTDDVRRCCNYYFLIIVY